MTLRVYFEALRDFNIDTIEEVADELIRTEPNMLGLPPPGRWRQVAQDRYELKAQRAPYQRPKDEPDCDVCQDTGWRFTRRADGVRATVRCECKSGGIPPVNDDPGDAPMIREVSLILDGEIGPQPNENDYQRQKREHGNRIVHCPCCGNPYRIRTGWRCCAPPAGMSVARWMGLWHRKCPKPMAHAKGHSEDKCPNHCTCTPAEKKLQPAGLLPQPREGEHVHDFAVRLGIRAAAAPGPDAEPPKPAMSLESEWDDEVPPPGDADA